MAAAEDRDSAGRAPGEAARAGAARAWEQVLCAEHPEFAWEVRVLERPPEDDSPEGGE